MVDTINEQLHINNQCYSNAPLSVAIGMATSRDGETMESLVKRADLNMYEDKRAGQNGASSNSTEANQASVA